MTAKKALWIAGISSLLIPAVVLGLLGTSRRPKPASPAFVKSLKLVKETYLPPKHGGWYRAAYTWTGTFNDAVFAARRELGSGTVVIIHPGATQVWSDRVRVHVIKGEYYEQPIEHSVTWGVIRSSGRSDPVMIVIEVPDNRLVTRMLSGVNGLTGGRL